MEIVGGVDSGLASVCLRSPRVSTGLALLAILVGCGGERKPRPPGPSFVESGAFQTYSTADGRILRILYDGDGDHRAEVVTLYGPEGRAVSSEIDSNRDGTVDRWEDLGPDGRAIRVGSSTRAAGRPDTWIVLDADGTPASHERDEDGDGRVDHTQYLEGGRIAREEQDTDGDGRIDVWRRLGTDGVTDELDTDHDGKPDRRVLRNAAGEVVGIETDPRAQGTWTKVRSARGRH